MECPVCHIKIEIPSGGTVVIIPVSSVWLTVDGDTRESLADEPACIIGYHWLVQLKRGLKHRHIVVKLNRLVSLDVFKDTTWAILWHKRRMFQLPIDVARRIFVSM